MLVHLKAFLHAFPPGFRRYFFNTSWMFVEQTLRIVSGVLVGIWVARYLGPEKFGCFSYVLAITGIFAGFAKLGMDQIVVRDLIHYPKLESLYMGTAFWLKTAASFLIIALCLANLRSASSEIDTNFYVLVIACGIFFQSFEVVDFYFQSKVLSKYVSICKITQLLLSTLLKVYFILFKGELFWLMVITLIDQITLATALFVAYRSQHLKNFYQHFDLSVAQKLLKDSWPLILSGIAVMIYMRIDQVMLKWLMGEREVGLYSAAVKISEAWYFVPMIIANSIFPALINAKKVGEKLYYERLQKLYTTVTFTGLIAAIAMIGFSGSLITFLYGSAYRGASATLAVLSFNILFVFLGVITGKVTILNNKQNLGLVCTVGGALLNVGLNLFLIPWLGIVGAALASVVAQIASSVFLPTILRLDKGYPRLFLESLFWGNLERLVRGMRKEPIL